MLNSRIYVLLMILSISGCVTNVPVPVQCPDPPPVPQVLKEPVSEGPSLMQRLHDSLMTSTRKTSDAIQNFLKSLDSAKTP